MFERYVLVRFRNLLLTVFLALLSFPIIARGETTQAEEAAISAAKIDYSAYVLPDEEATKAAALYRVRALTKICAPLVSIVALLLILQLRIVARMRDAAVSVSGNRWAQGYIFFLFFLLFTSLVSLPFDVYRQYLLKMDGLSIQRWGSWWGDQAKGFALLYVFGGLGVVMVITFISFVSDPVQDAFTRPEEHAADIYGEEIVHGIVANPQASHQQALELLGESNLSTVHPSPLIEFWTDPTPPLPSERLSLSTMTRGLPTPRQNTSLEIVDHFVLASFQLLL